MATAADKVVLRICAFCLQCAKKEDYLGLLRTLPEDELAALMDLLHVDKITIESLCEKVYATDWKPFLEQRKHLINDTKLFKELNLI